MPTLYIQQQNGQRLTVDVEKGVNLREALLYSGASPYVVITKKLNCRGNGICATCGVFIEDKEISPTHWHDKAAKAFGYPRLSCQITVQEDLQVTIPTKQIWGKRRKI
jgi:ferredoxin